MSTIQSSVAPGADPLRQRINEFVGLFFYGTMLKGMRQQPMTRSTLGRGGHGEAAFATQLDMELAQRSGQATQSNLGQAIYRQLKGLKRNATHGS
jgi:hypothetical protein